MLVAARQKGKIGKNGDMPEEEGTRRRARERKVQAHLEAPMEDIQENRKVVKTKHSAGRAARSDTSHQNVDGEPPTSMRKIQTAEKADDNVILKKTEKSEECGSSGTWR